MKSFVKMYLMVGLLGMAASGPVSTSDSCPACDVDHCPKSLLECSHGLIRDVCGCCKEGVCLLREKEKCLNLKIFKSIKETEMKKFSACGEHMKCLLRTDLKAGETEESVCQCERREVSCGMDNTTYPSICQLLEAATEVRHSGPCMTLPEVIFEPETVTASEHESTSLNCEARGFPAPQIWWEFEGLNGLFKSLPGDDPSIAVHSRGGPEPFMVTSWLMVEALKQTHAGAYICVAKNSQGVARAVASVFVSKKN